MSGKVEKVSVALTAEMMADIKAAVASGAYASTSEVIREWYRDWRETQDQRKLSLDKLRALIEDGMKGPFHDGPTVMKELRARISTKKS